MTETQEGGSVWTLVSPADSLWFRGALSFITSGAHLERDSEPLPYSRHRGPQVLSSAHGVISKEIMKSKAGRSGSHL